MEEPPSSTLPVADSGDGGEWRPCNAAAAAAADDDDDDAAATDADAADAGAEPASVRPSCSANSTWSAAWT